MKDSQTRDTRAEAAQLLGRLLKQQGSLATLLPTAALKVTPQDKALLQELCYGVCRWQPRLQCYLDHLLQKPLRAKDADIQALLLLGLYQIVHMRVPDYAALNTTVEAAQTLKKPWAKKLINGVLRSFLRERDNLDETLKNDPVFNSAHPPWLLQQLQNACPQTWQAIVEQNNLPPPLGLRINSAKTNRDDYAPLLREKDLVARNMPFSANGIYLDRAVAVETLPGFADGLLSVQDEAAQLSAHLLTSDNDHSLRILDACCAPGGKTTHLLERNPNCEMVAIDISDTRLQLVRENLQRLGLSAHCLVGDASQPMAWWDGKPFDRILLDAPCSATGIVRRQPDIKILRNAATLTKLLNTQTAMLNALWPLLAPNGILLYATCSVLPQENVERMQDFFSAHNDAEEVAIEADWGIAQTIGRQLFPQANGHDGFYYARVKKITGR